MEDSRYLVVPRAVEQTAASSQGVGDTRARYLVAVLLMSLALGYTFDFLFYGRLPGISVPIFVALFVAGLLVALRVRGVPVAWRNLWLLAPLLFFAVMACLRANVWLTVFNLAATALILLLTVYFLARGKTWELGVLGYPAVAGKVGLGMLGAAGPEIARARREIPDKRRSRQIIPILRGLVLALPVLILFGGLLASADRFFAQFLSDTFGLKVFENFGVTLWRIVIILVVAWLVAGAMLYAATRGVERDEARVPGRPRFGPLVGTVEGVVVLALVNLLFAIFAWLQFANLFFGPLSTQDYEGYREYVRRGFGELLVVCVLTLFLILGIRRIVDFRSPRALLLYRVLATVMVALTGVMLVSAYWRMEYWQQVMFYISTPLRIYVAVFIIWLGALFAWLVLASWWGKARFGIGAFLAAVGFLVTVNLINPDASVAAYNLSLEDELSTRYLYVLSEDAVPALARGPDTVRDPVVRVELRRHLMYRLQGIEEQRSRDEWPSFHFSKSEAYSVLKRLQEEGRIGPIP